MLWWIETIAVCVLIPTPGMFVGLALAPFWVCTLASHVRNGRSLGPVGYWYSVLFINAQALVVLALPFTEFTHTQEWVLWSIGAVLSMWLGVCAWFASEPGLP